MRRKIQALFLTLMLILTSAFPALAVQYGDQGEDVLGMKNALYQLGYPVSLDNNDYDDDSAADDNGNGT